MACGKLAYILTVSKKLAFIFFTFFVSP